MPCVRLGTMWSTFNDLVTRCWLNMASNEKLIWNTMTNRHVRVISKEHTQPRTGTVVTCFIANFIISGRAGLCEVKCVLCWDVCRCIKLRCGVVLCCVFMCTNLNNATALIKIITSKLGHINSPSRSTTCVTTQQVRTSKKKKLPKGCDSPRF